MMLRIQHERMHGHFIPSVREYFALFGMTPERLRRAQDDVIVMHPGPMNRGVEIDSEVADGPYSVILEQVSNGVAVRMAVLYLLAGRDAEEPESKCHEAAAEGRPGRSIPANGRDGAFDVLIEDGRIARVGKDLPVDGAEVFEVARGWIVAPGLIDIHVHLREPGQEHKETIATGAAVRGRRRLHRGRLHAEHRSGERPRRHHPVHPQEGGRSAAWRASIRSARCRSGRAASSWPSSASRRPPAASRSPTTAGRWRRRC